MTIAYTRRLPLLSLMLVATGIGCGQTTDGTITGTASGGSSQGNGGTNNGNSSKDSNFALGGNQSSKSNTNSSSLGGASNTSQSSSEGGSQSSTSRTTSSVGGAATSSNQSNPSGGSSATASSSKNGGSNAVGGSKSTSSSSASGGAGAGSNKPAGGTTGTGTTRAGGASSTSSTSGGSSSSSATGVGGNTSATGNCTFNVTTKDISKNMATVGIVEWSTSLTNLSSAQIVYTLNNAGSSILNKGGTAPVDLKKTNYRTLLLGLKQASDYTFHIEAKSSDGTTCKSSDYALTKTGSLSGAPTVTRTATNATAQASGFIVTSTGIGGGGMGGGGGSNAAFIVDADGAVVWYASAPTQCSRARMDYEGNNLWMLSLNVGNTGGEMRFVSMDGATTKTNVAGLSGAHHDFTVVPGKIAAMVWASSGTDPESNLVEMASDGSGSAATIFKIGANLYVGGASAMGMGGGTSSFHCNSILYHPADDSFTIGDRNPNLYVKVSHAGAVQWQLGGSCTSAPAGSKCVGGDWKVNHGHHLTDSGNFLLFNNGQSGNAKIYEFKLNTSGTFAASSVKTYSGSSSSNTLGDVQRLPNGNTLVTYSNSSQIVELDSSWNTVQTLKFSAVGYADWRETLYGPPAR